MTTVLTREEKKPKGRIFSYQWQIHYHENGFRKIAEYLTENKGVNARNAVEKRFEKEYPNKKIITILCD